MVLPNNAAMTRTCCSLKGESKSFLSSQIASLSATMSSGTSPKVRSRTFSAGFGFANDEPALRFAALVVRLGVKG